eukprot:GHVT01102551.1.p1 GENE.GHVT01102551.1~~GHVT01102551.1.p1  ORF type:complete len:559 (+),score=111.42 GHVT01102551.1:132-1679(+)
MTGMEFQKLVGGVVCATCNRGVCDCPADERSAKERGMKVRVDVLKNPSAFDLIAERLEVLARSQPSDKYALVTGLKLRGAVVAVTGDGTNDAPALKKADVGFAMGIAGKEIAKAAADIVLLDDNFESIVKAILWGRSIYDNIRRFLQFQLTVNVAAVLFTFLAVLVTRDSPLTTVQMLWVNLIMDTLGSLALATEPPSLELLKRKPHKRTDYLVNKVMFRNIIGQVVYQMSVLLLLFLGGEFVTPELPWTYLKDETREKFPEFCEFSDCEFPSSSPFDLPSGSLVRSGRQFFPFKAAEDYKRTWAANIGPSRHYTFIFNVFVFMQLFNLVNARKISDTGSLLSGFFRNRMWTTIVIVITIIQVVVVQFGGYGIKCHLQGLTGVQWLLSIGFGAGTVLVAHLLRFIPLKLMPEAGQKEVDPLAEAPSLALASRGRFLSGRMSGRLTVGLGLSTEERKAFTQMLSGTDLRPSSGVQAVGGAKRLRRGATSGALTARRPIPEGLAPPPHGRLATVKSF